MKKQQFKKLPGHKRGTVIYTCQSMSWRGKFYRRISPRNKGACGCLLLSLVLSINTLNTGSPLEPGWCPHFLSNLLTPSPAHMYFCGSALLSHISLSPGTVGPLPQKISANLANIKSPDPCVLWGLGSGSSGSSRYSEVSGAPC